MRKLLTASDFPAICDGRRPAVQSSPLLVTDVGEGGLPALPEGSAFILNADDSYMRNADNAYILAKA